MVRDFNIGKSVSNAFRLGCELGQIPRSGNPYASVRVSNAFRLGCELGLLAVEEIHEHNQPVSNAFRLGCELGPTITI